MFYLWLFTRYSLLLTVYSSLLTAYSLRFLTCHSSLVTRSLKKSHLSLVTCYCLYPLTAYGICLVTCHLSLVTVFNRLRFLTRHSSLVTRSLKKSHLSLPLTAYRSVLTIPRGSWLVSGRISATKWLRLFDLPAFPRYTSPGFSIWQIKK